MIVYAARHDTYTAGNEMNATQEEHETRFFQRQPEGADAQVRAWKRTYRAVYK